MAVIRGGSVDAWEQGAAGEGEGRRGRTEPAAHTTIGNCDRGREASLLLPPRALRDGTLTAAAAAAATAQPQERGIQQITGKVNKNT
mmetsp:Transcript_5006/g.15227  ORF Transcript_5006/g.15227 Transcript_5006/m.15227 type:complete len:87 (-) Transcript_5006:48-308(-)